VNERTYCEFDHSGDVGIEAWGDTHEKLFENATLGLLSLMATGPVGVVIRRELRVTSDRPSDLLVDWLSEIISTGAAHGEIYSGVRVDTIGERSAHGTVVGASVDPSRHDLRFDVKAATYHGLLYEQTRTGYHARVIFDL
jgi:SHS2 domain-containing protein